MSEAAAALREELGLPAAFAPEVEAAAAAAAAQARGADRPPLDLPFVTVDPPGARDLDQALHLARRPGGGWDVAYAIADVAAWVDPGGPVDAEAHARGVTVYLPGAKVPLHPLVLSEGAASLLPGASVPAVVWRFVLDADGAVTARDVGRFRVRSTAQLTYAQVDGDLAALLREVGEARIAQERARGGVSLRVPEQEVVEDGAGGWRLAYRAPLPAEDHNAQLSLLTGIEAARLMLDGGIGILRTQPPPDDRALRRLRVAATALGAPWADDVAYPDWVAALDPADPRHAALLHQAAAVGRGAGYSVLGAAPATSRAHGVPNGSPGALGHFAIAAPYAHVTAPLRRLADRFATEVCLALHAGTEVPAWARDGLQALPGAMGAGTQRANRAERAAIDLLEATVLQPRVGETFPAIALDADEVQLTDPAVRARIDGAHLEPGSPVTLRLTAADPQARTVTFAPLP